MKHLFSNKPILIISLFYFFISFSFLLKFGINTDGEASKFIDAANSILNGKPLAHHIFSYFYYSYSLIVAFFLKLSLGYHWVAVFHIFLSYLSALMLYDLVLKKYKNTFLGIAALFIYLFCYPIQRWVFFLYSEGVHTSVVVIGLCFFVKFLENKSWKSFMAFLFVVFFILTTRPVGIIFMFACLVTFVFYLFNNGFKKQANIVVLVSLVSFIILLNSPYRYFINPDSLRRMEIICQVPAEGKNLPYQEYNKSGLIAAFYVVKNEIGFYNFFRNGTLKLVYFFGLIRPYFSLKNNLFLSVYLLLYPLCLIGLYKSRKRKFSIINVFVYTYLITTAFGIFVTCADWSNRFIAPVFPFIILLAIEGIFILKNKI